MCFVCFVFFFVCVCVCVFVCVFVCVSLNDMSLSMINTDELEPYMCL